jgi:Putative Ig domain
MRNRLPFIALFVCLTACLAFGQDLQMQVPPPQGAIVGQAYTLPLTVTGGITPYTWSVASGDLPPGLRVQPHKGNIVGTPTTAGTYHFTVSIKDSSIPQLELHRDFTIQVIEGITVNWQDVPAVHGNKVSGSAVVSNQTGEEFVLTVIVVAVNQIGRATALGYQHFKVPAGSTSPVIPFGSSPGMGTYYVRLDAVAHRAGKKHIFRASKQTSADLKVSEL